MSNYSKIGLAKVFGLRLERGAAWITSRRLFGNADTQKVRMTVLTTGDSFGQKPLKLKGGPSPEEIFNADTIPRLRCRIIGGGANNQLLTEDDGDAIHARGILYAPDFAINAGGLINVANELTPGGYRSERAKAKTETIADTLKTIFAQAKQRDVPPHRLAVTPAQERIQAVRELRRLNTAT